MASNGWGLLGQALSGGNNEQAYQRGQMNGAKLTSLLAEASIKRDEAMQREQLESRLATAGSSPEQAGLLATALRGGFDPTKITGYTGDVQEQGFRQSAVDRASAGDWGSANAALLGVANGPVDLAAIQGQNLISNRLLPGGGAISTTEQGRAGMAADAARAAASYAAANSSNASAQSALGRLAIAQGQFGLERAGQWNPSGKVGAALSGATGAEIQKKSTDELKAGYANQALAQDAYNFAAAYLGKRPEEVQMMTPDQIRTAVADGGRFWAGPLTGRIPGVGSVFNADLEAYANSAAGKQARVNNPSGPVSNSDFDVARKSVFSPEKPAGVNADLLYQALSRVAQPQQVTQQPSAPPVRIQGSADYNALPSGAQYIAPDGSVRRKK